jgi:hypothetical protein
MAGSARQTAEGVVRHGAKQDRSRIRRPNAHAVPYAGYGGNLGELSVMLRTASPLTPPLAQAMREAVWEVDPALPVADLATLPRMISRSLSEPRFYSLLFGVFAALAPVDIRRFINRTAAGPPREGTASRGSPSRLQCHSGQHRRGPCRRDGRCRWCGPWPERDAGAGLSPGSR